MAKKKKRIKNSGTSTSTQKPAGISENKPSNSTKRTDNSKKRVLADIDETYVYMTKDKLRLRIHDIIDNVNTEKDWYSPFGLVITCVIIICNGANRFLEFLLAVVVAISAYVAYRRIKNSRKTLTKDELVEKILCEAREVRGSETFDNTYVNSESKESQQN